jgi:hypothetical protein
MNQHKSETQSLREPLVNKHIVRTVTKTIQEYKRKLNTINNRENE